MTWRDRLEQGAAVALSLGLGLVAGLWLTACTASRSGGSTPPADPKAGQGPDAGRAIRADAAAPRPDAAAPRAAPRPGPDAAPPPAMTRRRAVERRQPLPRNYVE